MFIYATNRTKFTDPDKLDNLEYGHDFMSDHVCVESNVKLFRNVNLLDRSVSEVFLKRSRDNATTEYEILKIAGEKVQNFIINLIGYKIEPLNNSKLECALLLESATSDASKFLFVDETTFELKKEFISEPSDYRNLIHKFEIFIENCLLFLHSINYVYCDWKFENILVKLIGDGFSLKLADFGSAQKTNVKIPNPHNINAFFGSPNLSPINDFIQPLDIDDYKSVSYLMYTLCGGKLPWALRLRDIKNCPDYIVTSAYYEILFMKRAIELYNLDVENLVYWPNSKTFSFLNAQV